MGRVIQKNLVFGILVPSGSSRELQIQIICPRDCKALGAAIRQLKFRTDNR